MYSSVASNNAMLKNDEPEYPGLKSLVDQESQDEGGGPLASIMGGAAQGVAKGAVSAYMGGV